MTLTNHPSHLLSQNKVTNHQDIAKILTCNHQHYTTREIEETSAMNEELKELELVISRNARLMHQLLMNCV